MNTIYHIITVCYKIFIDLNILLFYKEKKWMNLK